MFPSSYLVFTIQSVVHICWKKYLLDLQETISHEACVSMRSWGKVWVSQNHSSLFDVPRKTQNGLMCGANCKMTWCGAQIISGHYSAHTKAFNVRMIALKPNFDCATVIVKHLCATYLGRCIFAAEVKDNGNLRDTHKSVTFARHSNWFARHTLVVLSA